MTELGKSLILFGFLLAVLGGVLLVLGRFGAPRLPGDILVRKGGFTFYFPIVSSLLVSLVLTILLNLLFRRR
ncbi:MAG: DUF2905 family protein [Chthonomonadales bacterium]